MQTRIGHVHVRYRVPRDSGFTVAALEDISRQRIAETCDHALADVFENDPTVYVLRRVVSRVALLSKRQTSEAKLAEQWGRNLCRAVVRTIAYNHDDDNLVRFENQADFVTCFITRLALGDAWDRWYFGAFSNYRGLPLEDIVLSVLRDNQEFVPEIFGRLQKSNALELVINLLGASNQRALWQRTVRGAAADVQTTDAFRIFAQAAFEIVDALSLWTAVRPSAADLLSAYLRTKPHSPDWTNGTSLAGAVTALLRFMVVEGVVNVSVALTDDQVANLNDLLASRFDWLNANHLLNSLLSLFESPQLTTPERAFTLRPVRATPAQQRQLEELLRLVRTQRVQLTGDTAYADLLRLLAVFSEAESSTANMPALLESVVMTAIALRQSRSPHDALQQLQRGELPSESPSEQASSYFKTVIAAGEPAVKLVAELVQQTEGSTSEYGETIQTECAGLFLLTRAIRDLRLPAALHESGFESIHPLLAGLAIVISPSAWSNNSLEAGAAAWCGIEPENVDTNLSELESLNREQFLTIVHEIVAGQHLVDDSRVHEPIAHVAHPSSAATIEMLEQLCHSLLATWGRWLPGLGNSSSNYMLDNFIRRPGTITVGHRQITVELERRPLDEVLKLSGYLDQTLPVPWLKNRTIDYRLS